MSTASNLRVAISTALAAGLMLVLAPNAVAATIVVNDPRKKFKATFEFSSEPGASFECSLDGDAFEPCSSPHTEKVKKGKHEFAVRAKDVAGNVDGTPAEHSFKVKKKKK